MSDCSSSQAGSDYYEPEPEQLYDAHITPLLEAITAARTDQDGWDRGSVSSRANLPLIDP